MIIFFLSFHHPPFRSIFAPTKFTAYVPHHNKRTTRSPYAKDSGSRYITLFRTAHGEVKETRRNVIFQLSFPKRMGKALIQALLREEQEEQQAFVKTRREETNWAL